MTYSYTIITNMDGPSPESPTYIAYPIRWWILMVFSLLCGHQFMVWNAFGPITASMEFAFNWTLGDISWMTMWGTLTFLAFVFPFLCLMEKYGLTFVVRLMAFLIFAGASFRMFKVEGTAFLWLAHVGSIFNGIAGALVMSAPSALSAAWFPPGERMIATSIAQACAFLGSGLSFLVGPAMVSEPNSTMIDVKFNDIYNNSTGVDNIIEEIREYMVVDTVIAFLLFVLTIIYFPNQPPTPPSASSSSAKTNILAGVKEIVTTKDAWFCAFAYAIPGGTLLAWQGIITKNFEEFGIGDKDIGYIGLAMSISCAMVATVISILVAKKLRTKLKMTIICLLGAGAFFFLWLSLICQDYISYSYWQVCVSTIGGSCCVFSLTPVFFEYTAELTYPLSEGLSGGWLCFFYNFFGTVVFACSEENKYIGVIWVDWVLFGSCLVAIPLVWFTTETYKRLEVDRPSQGSILLQNPSSQSYQTLT